MAGSGYATNSRRKILDFLKSNSDRTVTAADIDQYLKRNGDAVNITTIYRYLDKLATDGTVMKYVADAEELGELRVLWGWWWSILL